MQDRNTGIKECVRSVTVQNWDQRMNFKSSILTIRVKTLSGKQCTVKTNGQMTVGQIIAAIVEALK